LADYGLARFGTHIITCRGHASYPLDHVLVVLDKIVQVLVHILGLGADGADGIAVVAVIEEDVGVSV
jgi:hypothetical protein